MGFPVRLLMRVVEGGCVSSLSMIPKPAKRDAAVTVHRDRVRGASLRLLPTGDGWSLLSSDGSLVYSALGRSARQRCLEFAEAWGVLALLS